MGRRPLDIGLAVDCLEASQALHPVGLVVVSPQLHSAARHSQGNELPLKRVDRRLHRSRCAVEQSISPTSYLIVDSKSALVRSTRSLRGSALALVSPHPLPTSRRLSPGGRGRVAEQTFGRTQTSLESLSPSVTGTWCGMLSTQQVTWQSCDPHQLQRRDIILLAPPLYSAGASRRV